MFAALVAADTPAVHLALAGFGHPTAAWIATAASAYSVVWLVGDLHALRHGGVAVTADALALRLGVRWRGRIPLAAIALSIDDAGAFAQMLPQLNEYSSPPAASRTSTPKSFAHTS